MMMITLTISWQSYKGATMLQTICLSFMVLADIEYMCCFSAPGNRQGPESEVFLPLKLGRWMLWHTLAKQPCIVFVIVKLSQASNPAPPTSDCRVGHCGRNNWRLLPAVGTSASILQKRIAAEVARCVSQPWLPAFLRKQVTIFLLIFSLIIAAYFIDMYCITCFFTCCST